ncbi:MAG TPA: hypothetical protein VFB52_08650 [Solirubrobacterales bacterium]|nr:hypothetical protein [Solirubrobacterales bacterium]
MAVFTTDVTRPVYVFRRLVALVAALVAVSAPAAAVAAPGDVTTYPLAPGADPRGIVSGPGGALWFTQGGAGGLGRITTAGEIAGFPAAPTGSALQLGPIAVGPDGNLWYGGLGGLGRMTPAGVAESFPFSDFPKQLAAGPDGALWFSGVENGRLGRITTAGELTYVELPNSIGPAPADQTEVTGITTGPDGNVWFGSVNGRCYCGKGLIPGEGRIGTISAGGVPSEIAIPGGGQPLSIAPGPDGAIWFTFGLGAVGRYAGGRFSIVVTRSTIAFRSLVAGADGNLWFAVGRGIGRLTPSGHLTVFRLAERARWLTSGSDGNLWFTTAGAVGRLEPGKPGVELIPPKRRPRNGRLAVDLFCSGGGAAACAGRAKLIKKTFLRREHGEATYRTRLLGRGRYSVPGESGGRMVVRLNSLGRKLVREGPLSATLVANAGAGVGARSQVRLRRP